MSNFTPKILYICGSLNQTTMMHKISLALKNYDSFFTPYFGDKFINVLAKKGVLDFTILGGRFRQQTIEYLTKNNLKIDLNGENNNYDLIITCSDLLIPKRIIGKKIILVQEGMTDPETILYHLVKKTGLPRYLAGTAATGLSGMYMKFCVASEGYRDLFIKKWVPEEKIVVTGIPNFDSCESYYNNSFPYKNYVLAATSDSRETFKYENRKAFIDKVKSIAAGRQIIFKLHPNENYERAISEIIKYCEGALIYTDVSINEMIANCDVLVTKFSSVVYVGLALGKEVYSDFDLEELKKLTPLQNGGKSAENIAAVAEEVLQNDVDLNIRRRFKTIFYNKKFSAHTSGFKKLFYSFKKMNTEKINAR